MSEIPGTASLSETSQLVIADQQMVESQLKCNQLIGNGDPEPSDYLSPSSSCDSLAEEFGQLMQHEYEGAGFVADELPIFSLKSISPTSRSLSPIDHESPSTQSPSLSLFNISSVIENTPPPSNRKRNLYHTMDTQDHEAEETMSLDELHARINTPNRFERRLNLETIFEGVFLDTPPKKKYPKRTNFQKLIEHHYLTNGEEYEDDQQQHPQQQLNDNSQTAEQLFHQICSQYDSNNSSTTEQLRNASTSGSSTP